MRSFLAFLAVVRLTSADESCTEAADEATLLQGRLLARDREANENQLATAVPNEGTQCWHGNQCAGQGGQCPSGYCGAEGVCCRNSWTARNAAEEEYCGANGYGNNGMHQCHPNQLTYRDVSQLPHMWQSAERSFGVEVPLDPPQTVTSVTVHSDWWMKRPDLVAVYATDQDGATHKLTEFEYGGSLDICSGGGGACSYPDDGTGSATSQRTVDINSDIVATSVRVQVVTPRNANGQPNGQVIIEDVRVNPVAGWTIDGCDRRDDNHPLTFRADVAHVADVRCCSHDGLTCQSQHFEGGVDFQTPDGNDDTFHYGCYFDVTHDEAVRVCDSAGKRLCNHDEVQACCNTGCWHNHHAVWVTNHGSD